MLRVLVFMACVSAATALAEPRVGNDTNSLPPLQHRPKPIVFAARPQFRVSFDGQVDVREPSTNLGQQYGGYSSNQDSMYQMQNQQYGFANGGGAGTGANGQPGMYSGGYQPEYDRTNERMQFDDQFGANSRFNDAPRSVAGVLVASTLLFLATL